MNKEIKKYEEINKKIDNKNKELKEIEEKYKTFLRGLNFVNFKDKEIKNECKNYEKKEKELKKDLTILEIQKVLVSNNIVKLFIDKYNSGIIDILKKDENKNIGEKTTEKIEEEIKEYLKDLEIEYIYFRLNKNNYDSDYHFGNLSINLKHINTIKYEFNLYRNYDKNYNYYDIYNQENTIFCSSKDMIFQNYEYIEDTKKQAIYIYNLSKKQKEKFEKLKEEMKEIRNNLNEEISKLKLKYSLMEELEIQYKINL